MRLACMLGAAMVVSSGCESILGGSDKKKDAEAAPAESPDGFEASILGVVSRSYEGNLASTMDAVHTALRKLDIDVTEEQGGMFEKSVEAEGPDGTALVVTVKELAKDQTRVGIKVGYLLGDEDAARRIHNEVGDELSSRRSETDVRKKRWRSSVTGATGAASTTTTIAPPGAHR